MEQVQWASKLVDVSLISLLKQHILLIILPLKLTLFLKVVDSLHVASGISTDEISHFSKQ